MPRWGALRKRRHFFGPVTLLGLVFVDPIWRALVNELARFTDVIWDLPSQTEHAWFRGTVRPRVPFTPQVSAEVSADPKSEVIEALRWVRELLSSGRAKAEEIFSAKHWGVPFVDVTPDLPNRPRRDEVLAWLKRHPKVKRFAVIDDDDDELDQLPLFQPSASTGLTDKIVKGVADYLDGKTEEDMRCSVLVRALQNVKSAIKGHQG